MQIVSWTDAKNRKLVHYFTGRPCKFGHISERKTSSGNCIECLKTVHHAAAQEEKRRFGKRHAIRRRANERTGKERIKYLARCAVQNALVSGKLLRQPCQRCGVSHRVHAHHDDYSKPLDVIWLCPLHHQQRHKELETTTQIEDESSK